MMNNWLIYLFRLARKQNIMELFGRRRNNRGFLWASLIGLGVSAAAIGLKRNGSMRMPNPVQNFMNNTKKPDVTRLTQLALAEFSKEITPDKNSLDDKENMDEPILS